VSSRLVHDQTEAVLFGHAREDLHNRRGRLAHATPYDIAPRAITP
jgi:hypothetical protein